MLEILLPAAGTGYGPSVVASTLPTTLSEVLYRAVTLSQPCHPERSERSANAVEGRPGHAGLHQCWGIL